MSHLLGIGDKGDWGPGAEEQGSREQGTRGPRDKGIIYKLDLEEYDLRTETISGLTHSLYMCRGDSRIAPTFGAVCGIWTKNAGTAQFMQDFAQDLAESLKSYSDDL